MNTQERKELAREFNTKAEVVRKIYNFMNDKLETVDGPTELAELAMDQFEETTDVDGEPLEDELFFEIAGTFEFE